MAVLEKIRVKFGILITVLIALALLSFIIDPQTLRQAFDMFSSENKVGKMNGESVSYKDFYEELNQVTQVAKITGQNESSEEAQAQLRDAAWQSIFDNEVFIPKATAAGLAVGKEEMLDLTQGQSISPVLLQQPFFLDRSGNFSREALVNFVQSIDADETGNYGTLWNYLEESVYRNQLYTKYASLLINSNVNNAVEKSRTNSDNNITADVDFVFSPISYEIDSTIVISGDEIKKYYNDRKDQFVQPENRDIEYVMWEVVPSEADFAATREEFDGFYEEFKTAENLKSFITLNSDAKWNPYYFSQDQLASIPEFEALAFGKAADAVSEVHTEDNYYAAARVADVQMMPDSIRVYFKMFPLNAEAEADAFVEAQAKNPDLTQFSELGWLTQDIAVANGLSDFLPAFSSAAKVTKVKSVNNQAFVAIAVPEKTKAVKKVQLAVLRKTVNPSDETYRDFQMKAVEFADACDGKYEKFAQIAKEQGLPVIPINNMVIGNRRIGPADNAREVVNWVFDKKTKEGNVSDLKIVDNKYYFVTAVTKARKEGQVAINDVAGQIKTALIGEKMVEKKMAEVKEKVAGMNSLEEIAEALGTTVSHNTGVAFGSMQNQSTDPRFIGAVSSANEGVINYAKGMLGVYVYQVMNRTTGNFFTEQDEKTQLGRKGQYQAGIVENIIAKEADVKDNRARFF